MFLDHTKVPRLSRVNPSSIMCRQRPGSFIFFQQAKPVMLSGWRRTLVCCLLLANLLVKWTKLLKMYGVGPYRLLSFVERPASYIPRPGKPLRLSGGAYCRCLPNRKTSFYDW